MPNERLVTTSEDLDGAMKEIGFPLALKIQSTDIPHKSEVGGVQLALASAQSANAAYRTMLEKVKALCPDAPIQGVLVGPMAKPGVEIIIGAIRDELFGPILMVGFGGITTELFNDVVCRPAPVSEAEALSMLDALKATALLKGFRGAPAADVSALAALIAQISVVADALHDVGEIELNPVIVHPEGQGLTIADALVVRKQAAPREDATKAFPCTL
jgi:acetyltransferase